MGNRKGEVGNQVMFFSFLFLLFVIAVGIVAGVALFYGFDYEFRNVEAELLRVQTERCVLNNELNDSFRDNFFDKCGFNKDVIENSGLKIRVCIDGNDCITEDKAYISVGSNFQTCDFEGAKANDAFPKCVKKIFVKEGRNIEIITASGQKKVTKYG